MTLQSRKQKFASIDEALDFMQKAVIRLGEAATNGPVRLAQALGSDSAAFQEAATALGLERSQTDHRASTEPGGMALTGDTLGQWRDQIASARSSIKALARIGAVADDMLSASLGNSPAATQYAQFLANVDRLASSEVSARSFLFVASMARVFVNAAVGANEEEHRRMVNSVPSLWAGTQAHKFWQGRRRLDIFEDRLMDRLPGVNLSDENTAAGKAFLAWRKNVNAMFAPERILRQIDAHRASLATQVPFDQARRAVLDRIDRTIVSQELPKLNTLLDAHSPYRASTATAAAQSRRLQYTRLIGSATVLGAVVPNELYAATESSDPTRNFLLAGQFASIALMAPYAQAYDAAMNWRKGASPTGAAPKLDDLDAVLRAMAARTAGNWDMAGKILRGEAVTVALPAGTAPEVTVKVAKPEDSFAMKHGRELGRSLGANAVLFAADVMRFVVDIYTTAKSPPASPGALATTVVGMLGNTSWLAGDLVSALAKGHGARVAGSGLAAAGATVSVGLNVMSIVNAVSALEADPDSTQAKVDVAGAVVNTSASIAALVASIFNPLAGLALMLVPDISSAGRAVELKKAESAMRQKGLHQEADIISEMHKIAALNATPLINLFSAIYTPKIAEAAQAAMDDTWVKTATRERLQAYAEANKASLRQIAQALTDKWGAQTYHVLLGAEQSFQYLNKVASTRNWVALTERRDGSSSLNIASSLDEGGEGRPLTHTSFAFAGAPIAGSTVDTVYQIMARQPESRGVANLTLDNQAAAMRTVYIVNDRDVTILAGPKDDLFVLTDMSVTLDGGGGQNTATFARSARGMDIQMLRGKNIGIWIGSTQADTVSGTAGNDRYFSSGGSDAIKLLAGDDMAVVAGDGAKVDMGSGNDVTFFTRATRHESDGNAGVDVANFDMSESAVQYQSIGPDMGRLGSNGSLARYEALIGSRGADQLRVSQQDSLRTFSLGQGHDRIALGAASGVWVSGGAGNDTIRSDGETNLHTWTGGVFSGDAGNDAIDLRLNNSQVTVNGGEGNDILSLAGVAGTKNKALVVGGAGDDSIELRGNAEVTMRFGVAAGRDVIYDSIARTDAMLLVVEGYQRSDLSVSRRLYRPETNTSSREFALTTDIRFGNEQITLNTPLAPGRIYIATTADRQVTALGEAGSAAPKTVLTLTESTEKLSSVESLLQSMAGFGGSGALSAFTPAGGGTQLKPTLAASPLPA